MNGLGRGMSSTESHSSILYFTCLLAK